MECARPNRSDVHSSGEDAAKAEAAARDYFDAAAPKRHTKPQRSDHSADYSDALSSDDQVIAEYTHFQELEKDTEVSLICLNARRYEMWFLYGKIFNFELELKFEIMRRRFELDFEFLFRHLCGIHLIMWDFLSL